MFKGYSPVGQTEKATYNHNVKRRDRLLRYTQHGSGVQRAGPSSSLWWGRVDGAVLGEERSEFALTM